MIIKPINNKYCHVCWNDRHLHSYLTLIEYQRHVVIDYWARHETAVVFDFDGINQTWNKVLTIKGEPTLMPSYTEYRELWSAQMLNNPFELNWLSIDLCLAWDRNYILTVDQVIKQQIEMWGPNLIGTAEDLHVYQMFKKFSGDIGLLVELIHCRYPEETIDYDLRTS